MFLRYAFCKHLTKVITLSAVWFRVLHDSKGLKNILLGHSEYNMKQCFCEEGEFDECS